MGFLKDIQRMAAKAARNLDAQQRQNERARQKAQSIITFAERLIKVANESLQAAADKSKKAPTRIKKLGAAKSQVVRLKQLASQYPFLGLSNLHTFESDIDRIENEIHHDWQLAAEQKKQRSKPTKAQQTKTNKPPKTTAKPPQVKRKNVQPKPVVFKHDNSYECLVLPRSKR